MSDVLAPPPAAPYSVLHGSPILFSGIVGVDINWKPVTGPIADELDAVFANVDAALHEVCLGRDDIVFVRGYLADFGDFDAYNAAWARYFRAAPPARATIGAKLHPPFRVEVEVIAAIPRSTLLE